MRALEYYKNKNNLVSNKLFYASIVFIISMLLFITLPFVSAYGWDDINDTGFQYGDDGVIVNTSNYIISVPYPRSNTSININRSWSFFINLSMRENPSGYSPMIINIINEPTDTTRTNFYSGREGGANPRRLITELRNESLENQAPRTADTMVINENEMVRVGFSYNETTGLTQIYVNGQPESMTTLNPVQNINYDVDDLTITLGSRPDKIVNISGNLSHATFYNKVLSDSEALLDYNSNYDDFTSDFLNRSLVAYYPLTQNGSNVLAIVEEVVLFPYDNLTAGQGFILENKTVTSVTDPLADFHLNDTSIYHDNNVPDSVINLFSNPKNGYLNWFYTASGGTCGNYTLSGFAGLFNPFVTEDVCFYDYDSNGVYYIDINTTQSSSPNLAFNVTRLRNESLPSPSSVSYNTPFTNLTVNTTGVNYLVNHTNTSGFGSVTYSVFTKLGIFENSLYNQYENTSRNVSLYSQNFTTSGYYDIIIEVYDEFTYSNNTFTDVLYICESNYVPTYSSCVNDQRIKTYNDTNTCLPVYDLPSDNGVNETCDDGLVSNEELEGAQKTFYEIIPIILLIVAFGVVSFTFGTYNTATLLITGLLNIILFIYLWNDYPDYRIFWLVIFSVIIFAMLFKKTSENE